jgi:hypothetical protein
MAKKGSSNKVAITVALITGITRVAVAIITGIFSLPSLQRSRIDPETTPKEITGYQVFHDDQRVGDEPNWTCQQALENLLWNMNQYPDKKVEGWFGNKKMDVAGTGYELYWDCGRVGYEAQWTHEQALENLQWNINQYPGKKIDALFDGKQLIP